MIPKRLHQVWTGGPIPDQFLAWRRQWMELHRGWDMYLWREHTIDGLLHLPAAVRAVYDQADAIAGAGAGQLRADIVRYQALAQWGGVYVDMDCEPLRPLDDLLDAPAFLGWEEPGRWAGNAVMGAERGHPLLHDLLTGLPANVARQAGHRPNKMSGPQYLTPLLAAHPDVVVYPKDFFYPYLYTELGRSHEAFPGAYCVHHWNNARRRQRRPYRAA